MKGLILYLTILICIINVGRSEGYKPVIFMHGLDGSQADWSSVLGWLKIAHPGQVATALTTDSNGSSHKIMSQMVSDIINDITAIIKANPSIYDDGFHLVGHSQGGLLTRAVLMTSGFNIINYVSCAGPQYGVYGNYSFLGLNPAEITAREYTPQMQSSFGVANYWHDGLNYENYVKNALWLSTLNNETFNPNSDEWKKNFLSAQKTVFNISPQDEAIIPWVSSIFGFWKSDLSGFVDMENQTLFIDDSFGLQTAYKRGSLITNVVPNVPHVGWIRTQTIFQNYILPYLD